MACVGLSGKIDITIIVRIYLRAIVRVLGVFCGFNR
jgi:hypothetical protein